MKKTLLTFLCVAFSLATVFAQKEVVGIPYSFNHNNISMNIDKVDLPAVDADKLMAEDAWAEKGTPMRVGVVHSVDYTFNNCGRKDVLADGSTLWRLSLKSPGALIMTVIFSEFNIPEGASLHIYNGDRSQLTGTYTNEDFLNTNGFMESEDILDDELVIEYHEPANALYHGNIRIERVKHIYKDFLGLKDSGKGNIGDAEGNCHLNVVCPVADPWRDQVQSVVCISITENGGAFLCSGAMINNVRQDKTPYVFTANHCSTYPDATFKFYFEYQTTTCDGNYGSYRVCTGGTVVASSGYSGSNYNVGSGSDFLLLKITGALSPLYRDNIVFAGWDAGGYSSVGAAIHHPGGDYKKISLPYAVTSFGGSYNKYWTVGWYYPPYGENKGCTEQGSSGSPLFNANGLIIGSLSTGSSACDYPQGTDNYGKISYSWTNNNNYNNAKKLKPWLDPDNTGTLSLRGMHYDGTPAGVESYNANSSAFTISPNPSIGDITVKGTFPMGKGICNVYNSMGMLVSSQNVLTDNTFDLHFKGLSDGIYFVEIVCDNHIYQSKMIIAR
ncbi:MAG: T9SS type A sorting domain-containing protein [Bacteroidales bacterium]|nr:T9SS type A sorting domain-containing protein [Bacteroidales bacterium]